MPAKIYVCALALATCLFAGNALAAQSESDDDVPENTARRAVRPQRNRASDDDETPEGPIAAPVPPQVFRRAAGKPTTAAKARRDASTDAATRSKKHEDPFLADDSEPASDETKPAAAPDAAGSSTGSRFRVSERRTTINRANLAGRPSRDNAATYAETPIAGDDAEPSLATGVRQPPRAARPATARGIRQSSAIEAVEPSDAEEPGPPPTLTGQPSLEEQIAELRARLDNMPLQTPDSTAAPGSPSTVQGSVFGPDAGPAMGGGPITGGTPSTVQGSVFGSDVGPGSSWANDGLTFSSRDGNFKTHLGGVVQLDVIGFANDMPGITAVPGGAGTQESVEFRRLRARADGTMYGFIDWVMEFDFALSLQNTDQLNASAPATGLRSFPTGVGVQGGNTINVIQPTTIFMTFKEIPVLGNVRVGNQQDWLSFEHIESARFQDFMERSPVMDVFAGPNNNGYAPGISAFNTTPNKLAGAQIGVYKNTAYDSGFTYNIGDAWVYGGRLIWSPYYDEESKGRYMVHTGFGSEYRTFNDLVTSTTAFDNVRLRSRGVLRNAASTLDPNYTDTGNFYATSQTLINPELMVQMGPFLFQSEYMASWFNGAKPAKNVATNLGSVFFQGYYAECLFFLTGENRDYNRLQGVFNRVVPKVKFDPREGTWGAWQAGVRYDFNDLNSGLISGGNASDMTFGLNWFLNANARFQFNYVLSWVNNAPPVTFPGTVGALNGSRFVGDGTINSFGARMDFNF